MSIRRSWLPFVIVWLIARQASAQPATVVQLPTFSFFTVSTTVLVPDSGGAFVGGPRRVSNGHTAFGPFSRARGIGGDLSGGGLSAHGMVHDFDSMDKALLAKAKAKPRAAENVLALRLSKSQASSAAQVQGSLAEARRLRQADLKEIEHKARADFERGRSAEAKDKPGVARVYYKLAARNASGQLRKDALARLAALRPRVSPGTVPGNPGFRPERR